MFIPRAQTQNLMSQCVLGKLARWFGCENVAQIKGPGGVKCTGRDIQYVYVTLKKMDFVFPIRLTKAGLLKYM